MFAPEPASKVIATGLLIRDLVESETPGEFIVNFGLSRIPEAKNMDGKILQNTVKDVLKEPASNVVDEMLNNRLDDMMKHPEDYLE